MFSKPKILIATDFSYGSDLALLAGKRLQKLTGGTLKLIHVSGIPPVKDWLLSDQLREGYFSALAAKMNEQKMKCEVSCESDIYFGNVADEIHKEIKSSHADILVMGHEDLRFTQLGSVAQKMISSSPIPVYVVKTDKPISNVVGLLDPASVSKKVVSTSEELSFLLSTKVSFLSVVPDISLYNTTLMAEDMMFAFNEEQKKSIEKNLRSKVSTLLDPHLKSELQVIVSNVSVSDSILDELEDQKFDLAVLSRHNRSAMEKFFIGSVGRRILERFKGNLIVLPEGGNA